MMSLKARLNFDLATAHCCAGKFCNSEDMYSHKAIDGSFDCEWIDRISFIAICLKFALSLLSFNGIDTESLRRRFSVTVVGNCVLYSVKCCKIELLSTAEF